MKCRMEGCGGHMSVYVRDLDYYSAMWGLWENLTKFRKMKMPL